MLILVGEISKAEQCEHPQQHCHIPLNSSNSLLRSLPAPWIYKHFLHKGPKSLTEKSPTASQAFEVALSSAGDTGCAGIVLSENEGNPLMQAQDLQHFRAVFWGRRRYSVFYPLAPGWCNKPPSRLRGQVTSITDICPPFNFKLQTKASMIPSAFGF